MYIIDHTERKRGHSCTWVIYYYINCIKILPTVRKDDEIRQSIDTLVAMTEVVKM